MANRLTISRRDFLNGVALSTAVGGTLSPAALLAESTATQSVYPPALTGLRGAHPGSFETAHALARGGATFSWPKEQTDATYDLVVVGGGLSGLAAAFRYRQEAGKSASILVIDNHDDFGGHAKRNEFTVDGRRLIGYGGSQSIDSPGSYSRAAAQILRDIGVDAERFYDYFDDEFFDRRNLRQGVWFSSDKYARSVTAAFVGRGTNVAGGDALGELIARYPLPEGSRDALLKLLLSDEDYLRGDSRSTKIERLRRMSYRDYLCDHAKTGEDVYLLYRDFTRGFWGIGFDALSALEAYRLEMPGFDGLRLGELASGYDSDEPYIFHFPDGNAAVARALVRRLVPDAVPGESMEDLVTAKVDFAALDRRGSRTRIRLNSTAVGMRHTADQEHVDISYVAAGQSHRVRCRHAIWAGYNGMLPHVCDELPEEQVDAIGYATKVPLVYISVAVRNWQAFANLGFNSITVPQPEFMHSFGLDFPVSIGGYRYTQSPDEPAIIHGTFAPTLPDQGLTAREQHRRGRSLLLQMSYADMEAAIVRQMQGALEPGGFDAARDIAAITVNRWPHGYAYEYNELFDPVGWTPENGPHVRGRAQIGRISIANSDASAYAYVDGAFDAAERAVNEQLKVS